MTLAAEGIITLIVVAFICLSISISNFKIGSINTKSFGMSDGSYPIYIENDVMKSKAHGTCEQPVMRDLRWNCDYDTADRICCFNRHYAEHSGYWEKTNFLQEV